MPITDSLTIHSPSGPDSPHQNRVLWRACLNGPFLKSDVSVETECSVPMNPSEFRVYAVGVRRAPPGPPEGGTLVRLGSWKASSILRARIGTLNRL